MKQMNMISKNLKWIRHTQGLTQEQIANVCHIDRSTYTYYEMGKTQPSIHTLLLLCKVLNVSLNEFVTTDLSKQQESKQAKARQNIGLANSIKEERQLILYFRAMDRATQKRLLAEACKMLTSEFE